PHLEARVVDDVLQCLNAILGKTSAEIPGRRGIGDATGAQSIEKDLIVAEQFQVLQTGAAAQRQVGQGQNMVRFMIGKMDFQHLQAAVNGLDQAELADHQVEGPDATDPDPPTTYANLKVNIACCQHRFRAATQVALV